MKKIYRLGLSLLMSIFIIGCSNTSSTTSGTGAANSGPTYGKTTITVNTAEGGVIHFVHSGSGTSDDPIIAQVFIRDASNNPIPGTVHWQDGTADRVFNGTVLTHVYGSPGAFTVAIQPDGGEKITINPGGTTFSVPEPTPEPEPVAATTITVPMMY